MLTNKNILIISPEPWDHIFVSKHHYAIALGKKGNKVFFLNPPSARNACSSTAYENVFAIDYKPVFRGLNYMPAMLSAAACMLDVARIIRLSQVTFDVVWSFDPYRFQSIDAFKATIALYFAADWHAGRRMERLLADRTSLVFSPSRLILESIRTKTRKVFLNHAVAEYFFQDDGRESLPGTNAIKVGYVGNLQSKFLHSSLLTRVVEENLHCDFIFVGQNNDDCMKELKNMSNVFFQGAYINQHVPSFLRACDILLLCYDTDRYRIEASNSHKIMEYLASGRTIVSTPIGEYLQFPDLVVMPKELNDLPSLLNHVSKNLGAYNNAARQTQRKQFAQANTYAEQLRKIEHAISQDFD